MVSHRVDEKGTGEPPAGAGGGARRRDRERGRGHGAGLTRPWQLFRPAGIPVQADATLLVIAVLLAWSFWTRFQTLFSQPVAVALALASTLLFLASILAHELAHALEAKRRGLHVADITLYVFGGATRITTEISRPVDEFALTVVGPWTSIVTGWAFGLVAYGAGHAGVATVAEVAGSVGWLNVIIGVFNLLPGAPLDGGRILDSVVWRVTRDRFRAARASAGSGQFLGAGFALLGLAGMLAVSGGFLAGLWLVLIGWFLFRAASQERQLAVLRETLSSRQVWEVTAPVPSVTPDSSVEQAIRICAGSGAGDLAVISWGGGIEGVFDCSAARRVPPGQRSGLRVQDLMTPVASLASIQRDQPASRLLPLVGEGPVAVFDGSQPRGIVTVAQISSLLQWLPPLAPEERARRAQSHARPAAGPQRKRPAGDRAGRLGLLVASVGVVVAGLGVVPLPLIETSPGPALDIPPLISTAGPQHPLDGRLMLTSVSIRSPSAFGAVGALLQSHHDLLWISSVVPAGMDPNEYGASQLQVFRDSVRTASAVALRAAGYPVTIEGGGAIVQEVGTGGPAHGKLLAGDVVTGVAGEKVVSAADLIAHVSSLPAGKAVTLQVLRGDEHLDIDVSPEASSELGRPVLGVTVQDAAPFIQLPFDVHIKRNDIGGPSAGLMTALSVYAVTTGTDLTGGQTVAGTGTIDVNGNVGPVGGVGEKVVAAADAGASLFLVPAADAGTARQAARGLPIQVLAVETFDGALAAIRSHTTTGS